MFNYEAPFSALSNYQLESVFCSVRERVNMFLMNNKFEMHIEKLANEEIYDSKLSCQYFDEDQFNSTLNVTDVNLSVFHLNIRSLSKHYVELLAYLDCLKNEFDIIILTEIGKNNLDSLSNIMPDYNFDFVPSTTSKGGVGIFFSKKFKEYSIQKSVITDKLECQCSHCQIEDIWLKVQYNNNTIIFGGCYRHPNGNVSHFVDALETALEQFDRSPQCIFCGDINIDLLKLEQFPAYENYVNLLMGKRFLPTITLPTRITENTISLIDHIFVRVPNELLKNMIKSGNLFCDISDHLPNFCCINSITEHTNIDRPMIRIYSEKNINKFSNCTELHDLLHICNINDVNLAYDQFSKQLQMLHDKYFPLVRQSRKMSKNKPWITMGIRTSVKCKNKLYRKYLANPSPGLKYKLTYIEIC